MMERFKVWCKEKNEWEKHQVVMDTRGQLFHMMSSGWIPLRKETHKECWNSTFQDKDGDDIYENFIIKCELVLRPSGISTYHHDIYYLVVYENMRWTCEVIKNFEQACYYYNESLVDIHTRCEIIGNVFENPELIP